MEISECKHLTKCDFLGCNNVAKYSFTTKAFKRNLCFCEECLKGMYEAIAKLQVPKGIKSPFKLNKRLGKNND